MKRAAIIVVALAALLIAGVLWRSAASTEPIANAPPAPKLRLLERPATKPRPMSSVIPDAGSAPVAVAPPKTEGAAPSAPSAPTPASEPEDGPIDRREHPGPRATAEHEALKYAFQTIDDDVTECLAQWAKVDSHAPPQVMLAFEIDRDGLQKSWLEHEGALPLGVESCIAGAAYGLDWSHIVDQPAKLSMKFGTPRGD